MPESTSRKFFALQATDGGARAGVLRTARGDVHTPLFMPVATQGSVKAVAPDDLRSVGATVVLGNTYHLYLRPGAALIERFGGLHRFMRWDGPILTDSGGFQGFSLRNLRKIDEDGILFKSHIDGSARRLTPESAIAAQESIGADMIMPLDVCAPADAERHEVEAAERKRSGWDLEHPRAMLRLAQQDATAWEIRKSPHARQAPRRRAGGSRRSLLSLLS